MMSELNIGKCKNCGHEVMANKYDLIKHTHKDSAQHRFFTQFCQVCKCGTPAISAEPDSQASTIKEGGSPNGFTRKRVEELFRQGKNVKEIAETLHLTSAAVYYHISNIRKEDAGKASNSRGTDANDPFLPEQRPAGNTEKIEDRENTEAIEEQLVALTQVPKALTEIYLEYLRATSQFPQFASPHEGYAVLLEEVDELWDEIKNNKKPGAQERMRKEATQVAAMAMKFLMMLDELQRDGFQ